MDCYIDLVGWKIALSIILPIIGGIICGYAIRMLDEKTEKKKQENEK